MVQYPADDPFFFNTTTIAVEFKEGYEMPTTLTPNTGRQLNASIHAVLNTQEVAQPEHIEFDYVNFNLPGVYNVTYDVVDNYNNTAVTVSRTVTVKDTTPPVLHLIGDPIMIVRYNETWVDPGAYATDIGDDYYYSLNRMGEVREQAVHCCNHICLMLSLINCLRLLHFRIPTMASTRARDGRMHLTSQVTI
jgi:hypothetical protein